jgi:hypothetical protein
MYFEKIAQELPKLEKGVSVNMACIMAKGYLAFVTSDE